MKKGFTLVELLIAIALIALLIAIAVPSGIAISNKIKQKMLDTKIETIENGAIEWGQNNKSKIFVGKAKCENQEIINDDKVSHCINISLSELLNENALEEDKIIDDKKVLINPVTNTPLNDCGVEIYIKNKRVYAKYDINGTNCDNLIEEFEGNARLEFAEGEKSYEEWILPTTEETIKLLNNNGYNTIYSSENDYFEDIIEKGYFPTFYNNWLDIMYTEYEICPADINLIKVDGTKKELSYGEFEFVGTWNKDTMTWTCKFSLRDDSGYDQELVNIVNQTPLTKKIHFIDNSTPVLVIEETKNGKTSLETAVDEKWILPTTEKTVEAFNSWVPDAGNYFENINSGWYPDLETAMWIDPDIEGEGATIYLITGNSKDLIMPHQFNRQTTWEEETMTWTSKYSLRDSEYPEYDQGLVNTVTKTIQFIDNSAPVLVLEEEHEDGRIEYIIQDQYFTNNYCEENMKMSRYLGDYIYFDNAKGYVKGILLHESYIEEKMLRGEDGWEVVILSDSMDENQLGNENYYEIYFAPHRPIIQYSGSSQFNFTMQFSEFYDMFETNNCIGECRFTFIIEGANEFDSSIASYNDEYLCPGENTITYWAEDDLCESERFVENFTTTERPVYHPVCGVETLWPSSPSEENDCWNCGYIPPEEPEQEYQQCVTFNCDMSLDQEMVDSGYYDNMVQWG